MAAQPAFSEPDPDPIPRRRGGPPSVRCLILDDDRTDRRLIQSVARRCETEFTFIECETITDALDRMADEKPDICIFDHRLPDGSGIGLTNQLVHEARAADLPIIVTSHLSGEEIAVEAMLNGAVGFVSKGRLTPSLLDGAVAAAFEAIGKRRDLAGHASHRPTDDELREKTLGKLVRVKRDVVDLLSTAWKLITDRAEPNADTKAPLADISRRAVGTLDDLAIDTVTTGPYRAVETVDLGQALREAVDLLQPALRKHGARMRADVLPVVQGVHDEFRLLFEQLILHGLRYARKGCEPRIAIACGEAGPDGWTLGYRDSGVPISDRVSRDRAELAQGREIGGAETPPASFGLSLCQRVVERNRGELRVTQEKGTGAMKVLMRFSTPAHLAGRKTH